MRIIEYTVTVRAGWRARGRMRHDRAAPGADDRQQVHGLPVTAGVTGAPHRLAVHGQRPPRPPGAPGPLASGPQPPGEPGTYSGAERAGAGGFQDPADGGLIRRLEPPGQRITADPETGQDLRASATHSPTAVNDRAPANTAAIAVSNNDVSVCRTPRGSRGSGTWRRHSSRLGHSSASSAQSPADSS